MTKGGNEGRRIVGGALVTGPSPGSLSLSLFLSLCLSAHSGRCCCVAAMRAQQQTPSTAAATVAASFVLVSSARLLLLLLLDCSVLAHAFFPPQLLWDIHLHDTCCGGGVWELVRFGRERERERELELVHFLPLGVFSCCCCSFVVPLTASSFFRALAPCSSSSSSSSVSSS